MSNQELITANAVAVIDADAVAHISKEIGYANK